MHPSSSLRFLNMRCQLSCDFLRNGFGPRIHQIDRITKIAHNANSGCQHNVRGTSVGTPRGSRQRNGFMWHPVHRHWEACCACDIYSHGPVAPLKKIQEPFYGISNAVFSKEHLSQKIWGSWKGDLSFWLRSTFVFLQADGSQSAGRCFWTSRTSLT